MTPGFHCSSLLFHDPPTLIEKLSQLGFGAVAIRPQRAVWDLRAPWFEGVCDEIAAAAQQHQVAIVIDLDAPYYDDPERSDPFSLASEDPEESERARAQLADWIGRSADLSPRAITFSTGRVTRGDRSAGMKSSLTRDHAALDHGGERTLEQLAEAIGNLSRLAESTGTRLALRPVAEHAIATVAHFERFEQWLGTSPPLGLAADVGEMLLGGEFPIGGRLARLPHRLTCVYLCEPDPDHGCDQRFGCGDMDLGRVWDVMTQSGFEGPGIFRACGHSWVGLELARQAIGLVRTHGGRGG
ncbi:TIM barrel protein [Roseiconus nitratireducens]|uniref:TIM barrel protein n=1 Tax=Roseiconus nitratireducens TaxID=2605748 RepID=A0A5M6D3X7_9BACT|nr:TIM barrel protein [Roseiconus nitratireducens]KAA5542191.1 TIM barrel protein [Roseiconus nitratireducens]